jgi:hypothetical protein
VTVLGAISPEDLAKQMPGWSAKHVRRLAKKLGACRVLGNRMALMPEDVQTILEAVANPEFQFKPEPPKKPSYRGSHVYFFQQEQFVKIGWSNKWRARLSTIQSTTPFEVKVLAVYRGGIAMERGLHATFAEHRVRLEWFNYCDAIRAYIEVNKFKCVKDAKNSLLEDE